ncbi:MAG: hypothetical protein LBC56_04115 [Oscillospiraceae bacterium]|jgi:hypothetical protein|nr:hypothetical protein [Oscillospiraceae bacterium]
MGETKRTVIDLQLNKPDDFVWFIINDFCSKEGFIFKNRKGEDVWQGGYGMFTAALFMKIGYGNGSLHLEAWMGGAFGGESDLDSFVGFAAKKAFRKSIDTLLGLLQQPLPEGGNYAAAIPVAVHNPTKNANSALGFGIASVIISIVLPFFGLISWWTVILGVAGAVSSVSGMKSTRKGVAVAGLVLSIIGIAITVIMFVLNIQVGVLGLLGKFGR